jgi:hypothetical protein
MKMKSIQFAFSAYWTGALPTAVAGWAFKVRWRESTSGSCGAALPPPASQRPGSAAELVIREEPGAALALACHQPATWPPAPLLPLLPTPLVTLPPPPARCAGPLPARAGRHCRRHSGAAGGHAEVRAVRCRRGLHIHRHPAQDRLCQVLLLEERPVLQPHRGKFHPHRSRVCLLRRRPAASAGAQPGKMHF